MLSRLASTGLRWGGTVHRLPTLAWSASSAAPQASAVAASNLMRHLSSTTPPDDDGEMHHLSHSRALAPAQFTVSSDPYVINFVRYPPPPFHAAPLWTAQRRDQTPPLIGAGTSADEKKDKRVWRSWVEQRLQNLSGAPQHSLACVRPQKPAELVRCASTPKGISCCACLVTVANKSGSRLRLSVQNKQNTPFLIMNEHGQGIISGLTKNACFAAVPQISSQPRTPPQPLLQMPARRRSTAGPALQPAQRRAQRITRGLRQGPVHQPVPRTPLLSLPACRHRWGPRG